MPKPKLTHKLEPIQSLLLESNSSHREHLYFRKSEL